MSRLARFFASLFTAVVAVAIVTVPVIAEENAGFKPIFNGQDLTGWDGNPDFWSVRDGAITGQTTAEKPTKGNTFIIWRQGELDDFELRLKFRIVGGNSGIQYRSKDYGNWVAGGYQADFAAGSTFNGILYEERGRGILTLCGEKSVIGSDGKKQVTGATCDEKEMIAALKKEDWNDYTVICQGNHLVQKINGFTTVDVTDEQVDKRALSGILALQLHAGLPMTVQFKDIQLKRLQLEDRKKIVMIAGPKSHGYGAHEHNAGSMLLAKRLAELPNIQPVVYLNGWPADPTALDNADAICIFCDGGPRHVVGPHMEQVDKLMQRGVGLACLHYAVEIPKGRQGDLLKGWIGGYFETHWSVNPHWEADFTSIPEHPITRGVKPFKMQDEWYFHMRFVDEMKGVAPILSAIPPAGTLERPDGPHSNNPDVRKTKGRPQHVAWAYERPDGGRGFGFTGCHHHHEWQHEDFRRVVLNALVWITGQEVPEGGVQSQEVTDKELQQNQDYPK